MVSTVDSDGSELSDATELVRRKCRSAVNAIGSKEKGVGGVADADGSDDDRLV